MTNRKMTFGGVVVLALVSFAVASPQSVSAAEGYLVDYRLVKWKSAHFDDTKSANVHFTTVTKLGCEAKQSSHGDHFDVNFVCPKWRQIELNSHDEAHQWEKWLKAYGFETRHSH